MDKGLPDSVNRKLDPVARYGLRATLFALAVALVGIPFSYLLVEVLRSGPLTEVDEGVARALNNFLWDVPNAPGVLQTISFLGKPIFLFLIVGAGGVWCLLKHKYRLVLFLTITCLGGGLVDTLVKLAVARDRPEVDHPLAHALGKSFPSGHAMSSIICYCALLFVFVPLLTEVWRRVAIAGVAVIVVLIGMSRLALGVHFLTDVVGGWVLGAAWLVAAVAAFEIYREDRGLRPTKPLEEGVEPEEAEDLVAHHN